VIYELSIFSRQERTLGLLSIDIGGGWRRTYAANRRTSWQHSTKPDTIGIRINRADCHGFTPFRRVNYHKRQDDTSVNAEHSWSMLQLYQGDTW
jgi:hypothetical protein